MTNINESISSSGLMVRSFTVYKFLTLLSSPFSTFDAFRKGIIDARGNYIKDMDEAFRSGSLDPLEVIIIKLKKIIATSSDPGLKSSLSNNLATFDMFLNEMYRYNILPHESLYLLESHCLKKGFSVIDTLIEDMSVGAGGIPGLSITDIVGPKKRRKKSPMFRRKEYPSIFESQATQDIMPVEGGGPDTGPRPLRMVPNNPTEIMPYDDWYTDDNEDGRPDIPGDSNGNGVDDALEGEYVYDSDGNGIPDWQEDLYPDSDLDNDGIPDTFDNDVDGDQIPNDRDKDDDGDGMSDDDDPDPTVPGPYTFPTNPLRWFER
jgi:hypothetical protein